MSKNYFEQESGRSMVEMLGVLAIIGVLSVGGISGYTTAMNKHKANEILNAATLRAMAVATQIQNGSTSPTLGEFTDHEVGGATFADGTITPSGGKITIGFTNDGKPSEAVIKQMENIAGTDGIVKGITDGGITFNDDLSVGDGSGKNTSSCPSGTSTTGKGGYATTEGSGADAVRCYCETEDTTWNSTKEDCSNTTKASACTSYTDCNKGEYCLLSPTGCTEDMKGTGTCQILSDLTTKTYNNGTSDDTTDDLILYVGPSSMDWWSAIDFCAAHGKNMASYYDTLSKAPYNCSTDTFRCNFNVFRSMGLITGAYWTPVVENGSLYTRVLNMDTDYYPLWHCSGDQGFAYALCE